MSVRVYEQMLQLYQMKGIPKKTSNKATTPLNYYFLLTLRVLMRRSPTESRRGLGHVQLRGEVGRARVGQPDVERRK